MMKWLKWIGIGAVAALGTIIFADAYAQPTYPGDRAVKIVVPYPPAGGTDILTRYVVKAITERTGWTVVVDNVGGATGMYGSRIVAKARPDGYTLLMGHVAPNAINPGAFLSPPDPVDWQLVPVGMGAIAPTLLLVREELGVTTVPEFMAWLAKQRDPTYGSDGIGSLAHLQMELLLNGKHATHVPYKGGGPAIQALLSHDFDFMFSPAPVALSHVGHGPFRVLAQTGPERLAALPGVPTMREAGVPLLSAPLWWGLFAPVGTPQPVIAAWASALNDAARDPKVADWMARLGYAPLPMSPAEFAAFVAADTARWDAVTKRIVAQ